MPSRNAFGVKSLRDAAARRAKETSIRAVAQEIGMSPSGLHVFLKGSDPHPRTREKLVSWYVELRQHAGSRRDVTSGDVDAAIRLLVRYIEGDSRPETRIKRLEDVVRRIQEIVADVLT